LHAQNVSQRGYLETTALVFPQTAPNDSAHAVGEALFRYEAFYKLTTLRFAAAVDARTDTHQETDRDWGGAWWDRSRRRPLFAVRRLSATYTRGRLTVEAGKQLIRWGKADVLTPPGRFAPGDFPQRGGQRLPAHHGGARHLRHAVGYRGPHPLPAAHAQPRPAVEPAVGRPAAGDSEIGRAHV